MKTIHNLLRKWEALNVSKVSDESIDETKDDALTIHKDQLMDGKGSDGQDLKPGYREDPFFKTKESAEKYLGWKQKITPNPDRNPNAPNLYINGEYHNSRTVTNAGAGKLNFGSTSPISGSINQKYDGKQSGLGGDHLKQYIGIVRPVFIKKVQDITGLKFMP